MLIKDKLNKINDIEKKFKGKLEAQTEIMIIGGGIGGLTAAAILSKAKIKTILIEKNEHLGGYYSFFEGGDSIFDYAISYVLSLDSCGEARNLLKKLEIEDKIDVVRLKALDKFYLQDGGEYLMPAADMNEFIEKLKMDFVSESDNIDGFFKWLLEYDNGLKKKSMIPSPFIIKNFLKDYEPFVRSYFTNQDLINILSMRIQADPASLFIMGGFLNECIIRGMYYILGGSFNFPLVVGESIVANGGMIELENTVKKISYHENSDYPYTVSLSSGDVIDARYIISNTSPMNYLDMLEDSEGILKEEIIKFERKISKRKIGHSSLSIYLEVENLDFSHLDCGRIYIIPSSMEPFDIFNYYRAIEGGEFFNDFLLKVHIPTNYDKTITKEGKSIIRVETDVCNDYFLKYRDDVLNGIFNQEYEELKTEILTNVVERLNSVLLDGINKNITYSRVITPLEFEKITLNTKGSGTGWAHTVDNYFKDIFPTKMSLPNSYIVGQWGEVGSGLRQLIITGTRAAEDIIKRYK